MAEPVFNILASFAEGVKSVEFCLRPGWRVLLDSGAFANFSRGREVVTLDQYVGYLREREGAFWRYFALDKIADHETSTRNLGKMLAAGLRPVPVFQRGGKLADLHQLRQLSDLVAVGGIAGRLRSTADRDYLRQVIRGAGGHKLHLLGCSIEKVLRAYRPYSSDSSSHAVRHGRVRLWLDRRFYEFMRKQGTVLLNGKPAAKQAGLFARLCSTYSIDPDRAHQQSFYGSDESKVAALRSYIRYQTELRRIGVEYFIACVDHDMRLAAVAWEIEKNADMRATA